jgi:hypothetical protein
MPWQSFSSSARPAASRTEPVHLAILVFDERFAATPDDRWRNRQHVIALQRGIRNASDVPQLHEDQTAGPVCGIGEQRRPVARRLVPRYLASSTARINTTSFFCMSGMSTKVLCEN